MSSDDGNRAVIKWKTVDLKYSQRGSGRMAVIEKDAAQPEILQEKK